MRAAISLVIGLPILVAWVAPAAALEEYPGIRPLGMGGASRAYAIGDAGPLLNPSGMSLVKAYTIEGAYAYGHRFGENLFHASIVDNTSTYNLAGGVYYTYHMLNTTGPAAVSGRAHEAGFALSLPFGEYVAIGATVKYLRVQGVYAPTTDNDGVTFDLGATIHPVAPLTVAFVGTNLYDVKNSLLPQGLGYGAALTLPPGLIVVADGRTTFNASTLTGRSGTSIMAGAEYTILQRVGARLGGGYDASTGNGYLTAGLSGVSEIGAIDAGARYDVSQHEEAGIKTPRQTIIGVSLRLFIPANQTDQPLQ
jgi:hypothetical protein